MTWFIPCFIGCGETRHPGPLLWAFRWDSKGKDAPAGPPGRWELDPGPGRAAVNRFRGYCWIMDKAIGLDLPFPLSCG